MIIVNIKNKHTNVRFIIFVGIINYQLKGLKQQWVTLFTQNTIDAISWIKCLQLEVLHIISCV